MPDTPENTAQPICEETKITLANGSIETQMVGDACKDIVIPSSQDCIDSENPDLTIAASRVYINKRFVNTVVTQLPITGNLSEVKLNKGALFMEYNQDACSQFPDIVTAGDKFLMYPIDNIGRAARFWVEVGIDDKGNTFIELIIEKGKVLVKNDENSTFMAGELEVTELPLEEGDHIYLQDGKEALFYSDSISKNNFFPSLLEDTEEDSDVSPRPIDDQNGDLNTLTQSLVDSDPTFKEDSITWDCTVTRLKSSTDVGPGDSGILLLVMITMVFTSSTKRRVEKIFKKIFTPKQI